MKKLKVLCGAGGTGGHLFPALAVIEQLKKMHPEIEVHFAGRNDKIEGEKVPNLGYKFHPLKIRGISKLLSVNTLLIPIEIYSAVLSMQRLIKRYDIDCVISTGSYISYPAGKAAIKSGIPLFLMESNVNPGKAINMLSKGADRIFTAFQDSNKYFPGKLSAKVRFVGNPVREAILNLPERNEAKQKLGYLPTDKLIFIFGGSLGARSINNAVAGNLDIISNLSYKIIWQTGKNFDFDSKLPDNLQKHIFIDDMALHYAAADLIISRSGATTVAELAVAGRASILVPLETASNNEQRLNAEVFTRNNAAIILQDDELQTNLFPKLIELMADENMIFDMENEAKKLGNINAAENTAKEILNLLNL